MSTRPPTAAGPAVPARPDRLSALLERFELRAHEVRLGVPGGLQSFDADPGAAWLHVVLQGRLRLAVARGRPRLHAAPCAVFATDAHRLVAQGVPPDACLSAQVRFGARGENPLLGGLPGALVVPLVEDASAALPAALAPTLQALFGEAVARRCGHGAVVERLAEVFVVQVLRRAIEHRLVDGGVVGGLADARLARAIAALHADPARPWTLEVLARQAGMSRARFAAHFHRVVGVPPGAYVARWRVGLAQALLRHGRPVKAVAAEVGYGSTSALGRAFTQVAGASPRAWLAAQHPHSLPGPSGARR